MAGFRHEWKIEINAMDAAVIRSRLRAVAKDLIFAQQEAGADIIELGIPFSDPIAEGVVIQEANERALSAGCTTDKLFDMVKRARDRKSVV